MNKNLRILIVFVVQALLVAVLMAASKKLSAVQKENTPPETYVYQNIYFEYPADWVVSLNETGQSGELTVIPSAGSPEAKMFGTFYIMFLPDLALAKNWEETIANDASCSGHENTHWHQLVENESFPGFECVWQKAGETYPYWEFFLYNDKEQMGIGILASPVNDAAVEALKSPEAAESTFPDILLIAKSLRVSTK